MVVTLAQNDSGKVSQKRVPTQDAASASIMLYEQCRSDAERLAALKLIARVNSQGKGVLAGSYPADAAHWICAKAFNAATSRLRAREKQLAEAFMGITVDLCTSTNCVAVTVDMCRETAKKFSSQTA